MKITALKAQVKNANRVSIFVDEKYSFSLGISDVIDFKLKKSLEVSDADIAAYKKLSSDGKIRARAYEWLATRPRSTGELKQYFYRKKVDSDLQIRLIADFTEKDVLSDERYALWATERLLRKNKSSRAIQNELRSKGITSDNVRIVMGNESASNNDQKALETLVQKLQTRSRYADQPRLIRYLQAKGFSYGDIKQALSLQEPEQLI